MSWIAARDVSEYQGTIDWSQVPEQIVIIKMSGGDAGLYYDKTANQNYTGAKAAGKLIGGYHFAGGGDPITEANFFVKAMSPLAEKDVLVLDWEVSHDSPVAWCEQFVNQVHSVTGVWPLLYINASTCNAFDWSPVLNNCGLWVADYAVSPDDNVPIKPTYVMHQYTDTPYDKDAWFGTLDEFAAYGYKTPVVAPVAAPASPPTVNPPAPKVMDVTPPPAQTVNIPVTNMQNTQTMPPVTVPTPPEVQKVSPVQATVAVAKGKKTYAVGLVMLVVSVEKYFTGHTTLSQYLTQVQGLVGANGLLAIALRAALAKIEAKL